MRSHVHFAESPFLCGRFLASRAFAAATAAAFCAFSLLQRCLSAPASPAHSRTFVTLEEASSARVEELAGASAAAAAMPAEALCARRQGALRSIYTYAINIIQLLQGAGSRGVGLAMFCDTRGP